METEVVVVVAPEVTTTTKTTVVPKKNFVKTKEIAVFNSMEAVVGLEEGVFLYWRPEVNLQQEAGTNPRQSTVLKEDTAEMIKAVLLFKLSRESINVSVASKF